VAAELSSPANLHILHADLTKYATLKAAAEKTAEIVGERGIDYLVASGGLVSVLDAYAPIGALYVSQRLFRCLVIDLAYSLAGVTILKSWRQSSHS
jgi:hypothetical protein